MLLLRYSLESGLPLEVSIPDLPPADSLSTADLPSADDPRLRSRKLGLEAHHSGDQMERGEARRYGAYLAFEYVLYSRPGRFLICSQRCCTPFAVAPGKPFAISSHLPKVAWSVQPGHTHVLIWHEHYCPSTNVLGWGGRVKAQRKRRAPFQLLHRRLRSRSLAGGTQLLVLL